MKKKEKKIVIGLLLIIGLVGTLYYSNLFSLFYDDYLLEDDFSQPSPALAHNPTNCITPSNQQRECTDTKWYIKEHMGDNYGRIGTITATEKGLILNSQGGEQNSEAKFLLNEKNRELKLLIHSDIGSSKGTGKGGFTIYLNHEIAYSYSESWGINGGSAQKDFNIEIQINPAKEDNYGIFVNGEKANEITLTEKEVYFKIIADSGDDLSKSAITLSYLKSKPFYSCKVDSDEVAVKTVFTEGTFSYKDLQPQPKQLCPLEYPIVKRSLTEKGSKNVASLFTTLQTGGSITVNKGELYEVSYVVDYKEGMGEKCQLDQALNLKTKKCEKVINEEPDVIEVVNQQILVPVGNNQIYYTKNINIADKQITDTPALFKCDVLPTPELKKVINSPENRPECWQESIAYNLNTYTLPYNKEVQLDYYFSIKWLGIQNYGTNLEKINSFILTKKKDLISITPAKSELNSYWVLFNTLSKTRFNIQNNYGDFTQSGIKVLNTNKLLTSQTIKNKEIAFNKGELTYSIDREVEKFGQAQDDISAYYYIGDQKFFTESHVLNNYEVVDKVPTDEKLVETTATTPSSSNNTFTIIFIIFIVIGLIIYFRKK